MELAFGVFVLIVTFALGYIVASMLFAVARNIRLNKFREELDIPTVPLFELVRRWMQTCGVVSREQQAAQHVQ